MSKLLCSVVVPVYKSEHTLRELYDRIDKVFAEIDADYELIFVEDCGQDNSWQVMKALRQSDEKVKIIRLTKNYGQHNALMCGFSFATGQYVITMDDDLQNPPEELKKLINAILDSDLDVVYGIPKNKNHSPLRRIGSNINTRLNSGMFNRVPKLKITNFRIIRKYIVEQILQIRTPNPIVGHLILKVTENIGAVTVDHHRRLHGTTTYSMSKLIRFFMHGLLYNSTLPLKVVSVLGVVCLCSSGILALYYLSAYLSGSISVSGFTTLVLLMLFFSGIIMFSIGIIGEYLLRIIQEVGRTPQYIIKDKEV